MTKDQVRSTEEALDLALEALEEVAARTGARWALEQGYAGHLEAITAIKQARSAPVQEHQINQLEKFKNHVLANADALGVVLDTATAPVQEPVAWTVSGKITDWSKDFSAYQTKHYTRPVYTPPAAQPAPVQEPVAWMDASGDIYKHELWPDWNPPHTPLYTTPPAAQRQWVGLTQEDIDIAFDDTQEGGGFNEFAYAIEQRLKEKNT